MLPQHYTCLHSRNSLQFHLDAWMKLTREWTPGTRGSYLSSWSGLHVTCPVLNISCLPQSFWLASNTVQEWTCWLSTMDRLCATIPNGTVSILNAKYYLKSVFFCEYMYNDTKFSVINLQFSFVGSVLKAFIIWLLLHLHILIQLPLIMIFIFLLILIQHIHVYKIFMRISWMSHLYKY